MKKKNLLYVLYCCLKCEVALTGCPAVTADVISCHPLDLSQDGLGELLHYVVLSGALVPFESLVQCLLFTVLKNRDPAASHRDESRHTVRVSNRESELQSRLRVGGGGQYRRKLIL